MHALGVRYCCHGYRRRARARSTAPTPQCQCLGSSATPAASPHALAPSSHRHCVCHSCPACTHRSASHAVEPHARQATACSSRMLAVTLPTSHACTTWGSAPARAPWAALPEPWPARRPLGASSRAHRSELWHCGAQASCPHPRYDAGRITWGQAAPA